MTIPDGGGGEQEHQRVVSVSLLLTVRLGAGLSTNGIPPSTPTPRCIVVTAGAGSPHSIKCRLISSDCSQTKGSLPCWRLRKLSSLCQRTRIHIHARARALAFNFGLYTVTYGKTANKNPYRASCFQPRTPPALVRFQSGVSSSFRDSTGCSNGSAGPALTHCGRSDSSCFRPPSEPNPSLLRSQPAISSQRRLKTILFTSFFFLSLSLFFFLNRFCGDNRPNENDPSCLSRSGPNQRHPSLIRWSISRSGSDSSR